MSSYVEQAEQLAKGDGAALAEQVQALRARGFQGRELLRDGSQYSPSWRALDGGAAAWELITEARTPDGQEEVQLAYEEQLTREEEALGLSWEEGCLWYVSEGYAEQEEALELARQAGEALGLAEREQGAEQLYGRALEAPAERNRRRALFGAAAARAGDPDFCQSDPATSVTDAACNSLHWLARELGEEAAEAQAEACLRSALTHFRAELAEAREGEQA